MGPREHLIRCMKRAYSDESIEDLICCHKLIIDGVMDVSSLFWSEELLESPTFCGYNVSFM